MTRRDVLIMVAPNGARRGKEDHPAIPLTAEELAEEALACARAGVAAMHVHVRDDKGAHSLDPERYRQTLKAISHALADAGADLVLQITTEAVGRYQAEEQIACVRTVLPEAVSLALRELVPDDEEKSLNQARGFFRWLKVMNIVPQFILYDAKEVARFITLWRGEKGEAGSGVIPFRRPFLLFVLGRYDGEPARAEMLDDFIIALGEHVNNVEWMVCAFGPAEAEVALQAAKRGGHVRIGFENNLQLPDGTQAQSNAALVQATADRLKAEGFTPMPAETARQLMRACVR